MEILEQKNVMTRKKHNCWGCKRKFKKGTDMLYVTSVDAGSFNHTYWCDDCQEFIDTLEYWETEDGWLYGELLDYDDHRKYINKELGCE